MNRSILSLIMFFALSFSTVYGQEPVNHLKKEISIQFNETELRQALPKIGEAGDFQFSYNSSILKGDSLVSVSASNSKVEDVLEDLLGPEIRYKVLGNHIILLADQDKKASREERKIQYTLNGYIFDSVTGEIISQASIYDVDERLVSATNQEGFFSLILPSGRESRLISFSKTGYNDTVIVVRPSELASLEIRLHPKSVEPSEPGLKSLPPTNVHDRTLVAALVPGKAITASENIPVIEERFIQMSFLPFVGSNHVVSGLINNRISVNILAGYSGGVKGLEVGGLFNLVRNDMEGLQLGGFGNLVGKDTRGVQLGGFFNVNGGSLTGLQASGFSNLVMDTIRGVQLAGFSNALRGTMYGPQISGFANFTSQNVDGIQAAGFANIAIKDVKVAQLSGFANYSRSVGGLQAAGFTNIASGTNKGIQISGFLNFARELDGFQISVFNICDTVESGLPIGFFSFVLKGYHTFEISSDELFPANISFKSGVRKFYNIFTAGANKEWFQAGYGLGTQLSFSDRWAMSFDLSSSFLLNMEKPGEIHGFHVKFAPKLDFKVFKHLTITTGPSLNLLTNFTLDSSNLPEIPAFSYPLEDKLGGNILWRRWIGAGVGIRF